MPYKNPEDKKAYDQTHKEERNAYYKKYAIAHREKLRAYNKKYVDEHRETIRKNTLKSYYKHQDTRKRHGIEYKLAIKKDVFEHYGGKCACCGETTLIFLSLDHVNGNGNKHRREIGSVGGGSMYLWIKNNNYPEGFQVLCFNCNLGRQINGGICPHVSSGK